MARAKATVEFSELRDLREQRWGAEEARRVLAAWRRSGLSLNAFAREHGFTAQRLGWWKQKVGDGGAECHRSPYESHAGSAKRIQARSAKWIHLGSAKRIHGDRRQLFLPMDDNYSCRSLEPGLKASLEISEPGFG